MIRAPVADDPVNVTPSMSGWDDQKLSRRVGPEPVDDVVHAGRHPRLGADLGEQSRGGRRLLTRLDHHGVTARERRRDLPREQQEREIPRHDHRDDAAGLANRVVERAAAVRQFGQKRGQASGGDGVGEQPEVGDRAGDVQLTGLLLGLPGVRGLGHDELLEPILDAIRDPPKEGRALRHRGAPPRAVQRSAARTHRAIDKSAVGLVHRGAWLAIHGVHLRPRRAVGAGPELAVHEVPNRAHVSASPRAAHVRLSNVSGSPAFRRAYAARAAAGGGQILRTARPMILDVWSNSGTQSKIIGRTSTDDHAGQVSECDCQFPGRGMSSASPARASGRSNG